MESRGQSSPAKISLHYLDPNQQRFLSAYVSTKFRNPCETHHELCKSDGPTLLHLNPDDGKECFKTPFLYLTLIASAPCSVNASIYFPPEKQYRKSIE